MTTLAGNLPYAFKDTGIDSIEASWRKEFEGEVAESNFLLGGKSLMLVGLDAEYVARQWIACLLRGGFPAYRATPVEIARRAAGLSIIGDDEDRAAEFIKAETMLIDDFFDTPTWSPDMAQLFTWFVREQQRNGVVLLLAVRDRENVNLNVHGTVLGDMIEKHFEVINGSGSKEGKHTRRKFGKRNG